MINESQRVTAYTIIVLSKYADFLPLQLYQIIFMYYIKKLKDHSFLNTLLGSEPVCLSVGRLVGLSVCLSVIISSFTSHAPIGARVKYLST